jgi:hypothetical protein
MLVVLSDLEYTAHILTMPSAFSFGRQAVPTNNLMRTGKLVKSEMEHMCQCILYFELKAKAERERF